MLVQKEVKIAKEADDVMALVVELVKHFRAGKKPAEMTELLDEFVAAVSGADQIDDELEANKEAVINTVLLRAGEIASVLLEKKADETPAES